MLRADLLKAQTTRTSLSLVIGAVAMVALATASLVMSQQADQVAGHLRDQQFYFVVSIIVIAFAGVLGVRSFTDEFRYGSVVPTFLLEPRRGRVVGSKMVSAALFGTALSVASVAVMVGVSFLLAGAKGVRPAMETADLWAMVGMVGGAAVWAALGVALGAAVRYQIPAIVGVIVWVVVIENVASGLAGDAAAYLPGRAAHALAAATGAGDLLSQVMGGIVLLAYLAVVSLVSLVMVRRDVQPA